MRRVSAAGVCVLVLLLASGCPKGGGGAFQLFAPKQVAHTSLSLNLKFEYRPDVLALRDQLQGDYPMALDGKGYTIFIKRIAGAGALLTKAPDATLYDFVADNNTRGFLRTYKYKVKDEKREVVPANKNTFYGQYLTFDVTNDRLPSYVPDGERPPDGTDASVFYARYYYTLTLQDLYIVHVVSTSPLDENADSVIKNLLASFQFGAVK